MDEIKKVKSLQKIKKYLKSEKFSQKKNIFIKFHEEKEGKEISKNIEKICNDEEFFFSNLSLLKIYLCMVFMKIKNFMSLFLYKSLKLKIILI